MRSQPLQCPHYVVAREESNGRFRDRVAFKSLGVMSSGATDGCEADDVAGTSKFDHHAATVGVRIRDLSQAAENPENNVGA